MLWVSGGNDLGFPKWIILIFLFLKARAFSRAFWVIKETLWGVYLFTMRAPRVQEFFLVERTLRTEKD